MFWYSYWQTNLCRFFYSIRLVELKKKSSCTVQLVNNSQHHVAYKVIITSFSCPERLVICIEIDEFRSWIWQVKTTSQEKYYVQPYSGVILPKSTCDFTGMMPFYVRGPFSDSFFICFLFTICVYHFIELLFSSFKHLVSNQCRYDTKWWARQALVNRFCLDMNIDSIILLFCSFNP